MTISGGSQNCVIGSAGQSIIGGGQYNIISGSLNAGVFFNGIFSGLCNEVVGIVGTNNKFSIIAGGLCNIITGTNGFIGAGSNNTISAASGSIVGGCSNTVSNVNSHIIGSGLTTDKDNYTFVNNLQAGTNLSSSTLTLSGLSDQSSEATAVMINGSNVVGTRELGSNAFNSTAFTTCTGTVTGVSSGNLNTITIGGTAAAPTVAAVTSAVANAGTNLATGDQIYDHVTTRISGLTSCTGTVDTSGTPIDNDFAKFTDANTIEGRSAAEMRSDLNVADGATACTGTVTGVTSGNTNTITIGGTAAAPTVEANTAAVANAGTNLATGDQIYDHVTTRISGLTSCTGTVTGTGTNNRVATWSGTTSLDSDADFTYDGTTLTVGCKATIGSGHTNSGNCSTIAGGINNCLTGNCSAIAGGESNKVVAGGPWGFIGGGKNNCVGIDFSSIAGGELNKLCGGSSGRCHDFIGGGCGNTVSTYYGCNVIVGGKCNSMSGYYSCLLYTSPSPRDRTRSRMPSSA